MKAQGTERIADRRLRRKKAHFVVRELLVIRENERAVGDFSRLLLFIKKGRVLVEEHERPLLGQMNDQFGEVPAGNGQPRRGAEQADGVELRNLRAAGGAGDRVLQAVDRRRLVLPGD